jgi:hypothetical protein
LNRLKLTHLLLWRHRVGASIVKKLVEGQEGSVSVKVNLVKVLHLALYCLCKSKSKMEEEVILLDPVSEIKTCGY